MLYFAYGSNMLKARIRQPDRVPTAEPYGLADLTGHRLAFHKRSRDGSGKGDAHATGNADDVVHGVLYTIDDDGKRALDAIEGVGMGYSDETVMVRDLNTGEDVEVLTYLVEPDFIEPSLQPYSWYRDLVLGGAVEHGLPEHYIRSIAQVEARPDPDTERDRRERVALSEIPLAGIRRLPE